MTWELIEETAERVSKVLREKGDEYAVIVGRSDRAMLKLANGEATVFQEWRTLETGIYLARRDGRMILTYVSSTTPEEAAKKIALLLESAEPSPLYAPLPEPTGSSYSLVDSTIAEYLRGEREIELASDLELDQLGDAAGMAEFQHERSLLVTSSGGHIRGEVTAFHGYMRVFRKGRSGQWSWVSTKYNSGKDARRAIQVAKELAETCKDLPMEDVEPGEYRVLLSPMIAGNLIGQVARAANAGMIIFGMSFIRPDMLGKQIASPIFTLRDEPLNQDLPGYAASDEEGIATRDKSIIESGVLKTLLHNTKTARLMGAETTGNAGLLIPRAFNLVVPPGDIKSDELLEALGDGIYITNNWYTRYQNYVEGVFSTVSRDAVFLVRGGRPKACLSRIRLTGRMLDLLSNIEGLGSIPWKMKWWEIETPTITPHILLGKANISRPA